MPQSPDLVEPRPNNVTGTPQRPQKTDVSRRQFLKMAAAETIAEGLGIGPLSQMIRGVDTAEAGGVEPQAETLIDLNVRQLPDPNSNLLGVLPKGTTVVPDGTWSDWMRYPYNVQDKPDITSAWSRYRKGSEEYARLSGDIPVISDEEVQKLLSAAPPKEGNKAGEKLPTGDPFQETGRPAEGLSQAAIGSFIHAMNYGGLQLAYDQVVQGLQGAPSRDSSGRLYYVAGYSVPDGHSLSGNYPLMVASQDESGSWVWSEITRGGLGRKKGIPIGAYVVAWMAVQDRGYREVLRRDISHFQLDDLALWNVFEPQQGSINQREFNKIMGAADLSREFGCTLSVGSGMILGPEWGIPDWLKSMSCSNEDLLTLAEQHIETFLTPFQNHSLQRVAVANEMLHHPLDIPNFWTETRGVDRNTLLKRAFRKARQVTPNAELALRDFSVEFADYPRSEEFYSLVTQLNAEEVAENGGKLIDAVEFQLPLLLDALIGKDPAMDPSNFTNPENRKGMMEKLKRNIRRFRQSGVNVYIVELMLPINSLSGSTIEEKLVQQAAIYADIYKVCMEEGVGIGLTRTNDSTNTTFAYPKRDTNTLPYPRNDMLEPLPSYFAINQAIFSTDRVA